MLLPLKASKVPTVKQGMSFLSHLPSTKLIITIPPIHHRSLKLLRSSNPLHGLSCRIHIKRPSLFCTNMSPWEPSPVTYAPTDEASDNFLKETPNIFETLESEDKTEEHANTSDKPSAQLQLLKLPMWILGPCILLTTGMVPTLWLPISSIFLGPNIASLLSLIGLDCIFNLGATLFLLMADSCSRSKSSTQTCNSKAPFSYQFWNVGAILAGFIVPLMMMSGSQKGLLQPQLPLISSAVVLGPYFLLLSVQILTEVLTWHWQSPVWLVTPVVYEGYRVLQLMRSLKLGVELSAPGWMMHTIRGLVCWWILILGVQLMRVAWFAGFTARARQQHSSALVNGE